MHLKELQNRLPWVAKNSRKFNDNPQEHKDFAHAISHAMKALGELSSMVEEMDHIQSAKYFAVNPEKYMSDLVICALRMANTFPGRKIDLEAEIIHRLESKNGVKLE